MKLKEFFGNYEELIKAGWEAKIDCDRSCRLRSPRDERYTHCPLTAVCIHLTGKKFTVDKAENAGKAIGMSRRDSLTIMDAADHRPGFPKNHRRKLLRVFGLKEPTVELVNTGVGFIETI